MKINVKGPIIDSDEMWIYEWFGIEATSPKKVDDLLAKAKKNEEIEVEINSGGGSVFAGSEIYTALKGHDGNITIKVVGLAASAASVIAMAGDRTLISPTAQMMIHNASGVSGGDYRAMDKASEILKNTNATIANAYMLKTRLTHEELLPMMDKETWLSPQQALESKFVDEIMFTNGVKLVASINNGMLPQAVIDKVKEDFKNKKMLENKKELDLIKNTLDLEKAKLKMRGNL